MPATPNTTIKIRKATISDLDSINRIVECCVMSWDLPSRVKRLAATSYRYRADDLIMGELIVGENENQQIIGLAAWEQADLQNSPGGMRTLQLHGIYVDPDHKLRGYGSQLLKAAEKSAVENRYESLMVKAQAGATGFFMTHGMQPLGTRESETGYAHRYWKKLS